VIVSDAERERIRSTEKILGFGPKSDALATNPLGPRQRSSMQTAWRCLEASAELQLILPLCGRALLSV